MARAWPLLLLALGCNPDPGEVDQQVGYRTFPDDEGPTSGERGNVVISEILWSGSVDADRNWDPSDVFVEIRNQGNLPVNVSDWFLEIDGAEQRAVRFPVSDLVLEPGRHYFAAAKDTGCFPDPDWVIPELQLPRPGDPFEIVLMDADERLIEPAGSTEMPPYAGGYDLARSRSMERVELMFGGRGTEPAAWHFYNEVDVAIANNDRVAEGCRRRTLASPGRANSPDYSGALSAGGFE